MPPAKLFPRERFERYEKGLEIDRLPCVPIVGNTAARVIGEKVSALRDNGKLLATAQIQTYRRFEYDVIRVFTDLFVQAEAMGANVNVPEDETAYIEKPASVDDKDVYELHSIEPQESPVIRAQLEAMARCVDEVGMEVPVTGALTGPFTNASFLVGAERLVRYMMKRPEFVHRLCEISLQTAIAYADAIFATGATPSLTDAMSSSTVISPKQFKEFSFPYLSRLVQHLKQRVKSVTLHICGKTHSIWELMADTGATCLSIDNVADLREAKKLIGHRVRLMGNIPPAEVMLLGSEETIKTAVNECVSKAWDNPKGYIVASGCSLPTETPLKNIQVMMDAVTQLGWPPKLTVHSRGVGIV